MRIGTSAETKALTDICGLTRTTKQEAATTRR